MKPRIVLCPHCLSERWYGIGPCSKCGEYLEIEGELDQSDRSLTRAEKADRIIAFVRAEYQAGDDGEVE